MRTLLIQGGFAMSGKMLKKLNCRKSDRWRSRRRIKESFERTMAAARAFLVPNEDEVRRVVEKYQKIKISNYPLLIALYFLVAMACSFTNSPWILLSSSVWFYLLLALHHTSGARKYVTSTYDYQLTTMLMSVYSYAGFMTAVTLVAICW